MLYIRKLFTQDLRDGKQIAFPKEPSYSFFSFDYLNHENDRGISFTFRSRFEQFQEYDGKVIRTRLYAAGSESRMDGEVKAFIRDELHAKVDDILILKNKGTRHTEFEFMFVPKNNSKYYPLLLAISGSENHTVLSFEKDLFDESEQNLALQQIFYGAPGTGKSNTIKEITQNEDVIRTTFHPDSDYSSFVGTYKPTTKEIPLRDVTGKVIIENGKAVTENRIVYEFVNQAFLQAYVSAWQKLGRGSLVEEKQYLVIEEINRGNCAQIFGDLFQLLDRNVKGFSEYPIQADADMKKQLKKSLNDLVIEKKESINELYNGRNVVDEVLNGDILLLPNNLYIWATMNTSDQSLFPIDSAFKRRWDWQYIPISDAKKGWLIEANGKRYDWWNFLEKMNAKIGVATHSEDKKLGYFFCKPKNGIIDAETFVGKVVFYIWNDVFKDFAEEAGDLFKDEDGVLSFNKFYAVGTNGKTMVVEDKVERLMQNLGVEPLTEFEDEYDDEEDDDTETADGKDYTRYTINGEGSFPKRQLSTQAVRKYIEMHPELTPEEVVENWMSLGNIVSHFVETKEQFEARTDNSKRSHEVPCGDTKIYVAWNGWGRGGKMQTLIDAVNNKDWGIRLTIKEA